MTPGAIISCAGSVCVVTEVAGVPYNVAVRLAYVMPGRVLMSAGSQWYDARALARDGWRVTGKWGSESSKKQAEVAK